MGRPNPRHYDARHLAFSPFVGLDFHHARDVLLHRLCVMAPNLRAPGAGLAPGALSGVVLAAMGLVVMGARALRASVDRLVVIVSRVTSAAME
jgi:hypothetical protein